MAQVGKFMNQILGGESERKAKNAVFGRN